VRRGRDRIPARADAADHRPFLDRLALRDQDLAELEQRDGVAVRGLDRDRLPSARQCPGERDGARRRGPHVGAGLAADVDAPVLATGVWVLAEHERA
jgi:hypothetical protein